MQSVCGGEVPQKYPEKRQQTRQLPGLVNGNEFGCIKDHGLILAEQAHLKLLKILILIIF
jgi:hypothetical protein